MRNSKKKMNKTKKEILKWSAMISVVLVLWITDWHRPLIAGLQRAVLSTGLIQPDISGTPENTDSQAPNLKLVDEQGANLNLADLAGNTVFLNIWATWCPPCKAEMPGIQNLYEDVKEDSIRFVMIATDRDFELAKKYKAKKGFTFPIYRLNSQLPPELEGRSIPRTYVLDEKGAIRMEHSGMAQYDTQEFRVFLNDLNNKNKPEKDNR